MTQDYRSNLLIIGLTGGIAAGKSTVLKYLVEKGFAIVEADKLGHEAYLPGTKCFQDLVDHFGDRIVAADGTINRKELGSIIFSDSVQMEKLNEIVWPAISALAQQQLNEISKNFSKIENPSILSRVVVFEAAVLIEAGWTNLVDEVWVVYADENTQTSRLETRNNLSTKQAKERVLSQLSNDERKKHAQVLLANLKDQEFLFSQVDAEIDKLTPRYVRTASREVIPLVDIKTDEYLRSIRIGTMADFHLCSRCCYVNFTVDGQYLVQKRSLNLKHGPGLLDPTPGGYNDVNEEYSATAIREVKEELGINVADRILKQEGKKFFYNGQTPNWGAIFQVELTKQEFESIVIDPEEVHSVFLMSKDDILKQIHEKPENFLADSIQAFKIIVQNESHAGSNI
eukprot:maker-scaffold_27-snap-gene-1.18-mRNA-1 protein AED:0.01 eAED:0.01 QI:148/1/1/1/1/1/3/94/398